LHAERPHQLRAPSNAERGPVSISSGGGMQARACVRAQAGGMGRPAAAETDGVG